MYKLTVLSKAQMSMAFRKQIAASGGAFVVTYKDESYEIFVAQELKDELSDDEFRALVKHEEGHIALKHMTMRCPKTTDEHGFNECLAHELEADAYAAAIVGKAAVSSMLNKIGGIHFDHYRFYSGPILCSRETYINAARNSMKARIDALNDNQPKAKMSATKKVLIGAGILAAAITAGIILSKRE